MAVKKTLILSSRKMWRSMHSMLASDKLVHEFHQDTLLPIDILPSVELGYELEWWKEKRLFLKFTSKKKNRKQQAIRLVLSKFHLVFWGDSATDEYYYYSKLLSTKKIVPVICGIIIIFIHFFFWSEFCFKLITATFFVQLLLHIRTILVLFLALLQFFCVSISITFINCILWTITFSMFSTIFTSKKHRNESSTIITKQNVKPSNMMFDWKNWKKTINISTENTTCLLLYMDCFILENLFTIFCRVICFQSELMCFN